MDRDLAVAILVVVSVAALITNVILVIQMIRRRRSGPRADEYRRIERGAREACEAWGGMHILLDQIEDELSKHENIESELAAKLRGLIGYYRREPK